ncbi:CDP-alcohol phosphatidyltransferase family protein [Geoglobus acetivorans]|uniref:Archaetidylinositol phosphate synthase n=1 Tax=Geoglobus acetivorans TaxID=565033 RepID=A0ABZ3H6D1_GEOAI|nr:CDP-alcohol phosphatidyltransferase family protein [Geoglobus acetivorans]
MLSRYKAGLTPKLGFLTGRLSTLGIRPNHLSVLGFLFGITSALLLIYGMRFPGVFFLILSGLMDALDGALARNENLKTEFGGFLDSVLDRYVDIAIIIGAGVYSGHILLATIAMAGALLVSYTRARAEAIIEKCDVGFAERGERTIILIIGLLTGYVYHALLLIAILAHITAVQRIYHTYSQSR